MTNEQLAAYLFQLYRQLNAIASPLNQEFAGVITPERAHVAHRELHGLSLSLYTAIQSLGGASGRADCP